MTSFNPELDLEITRDVSISPAEIWAGYTQAETLKKWFCPAPWRVTDAHVEPHPGGRFYTVMEGPEGERHAGEGCVLVAEPERRLVWTDLMAKGFQPLEGGMGFTGEILLEPLAGGGTRYRAIARHANAATRKNHEEMGFHKGWNIALDQLVTLLEKV